MNKQIKVGYEFSTTYILTRDNRTTRKSEELQSWAGDSDLGGISRHMSAKSVRKMRLFREKKLSNEINKLKMELHETVFFVCFFFFFAFLGNKDQVANLFFSEKV